MMQIHYLFLNHPETCSVENLLPTLYNRFSGPEEHAIIYKYDQMACPEEIRAFADARLREMWEETYKLRFDDLYNRKDDAVLSMRQITTVYPGLKELSLVSSFIRQEEFLPSVLLLI
jgi:hypothetical protein